MALAPNCHANQDRSSNLETHGDGQQKLSQISHHRLGSYLVVVQEGAEEDDGVVGPPLAYSQTRALQAENHQRIQVVKRLLIEKRLPANPVVLVVLNQSHDKDTLANMRSHCSQNDCFKLHGKAKYQH